MSLILNKTIKAILSISAGLILESVPSVNIHNGIAGRTISWNTEAFADPARKTERQEIEGWKDTGKMTGGKTIDVPGWCQPDEAEILTYEKDFRSFFASLPSEKQKAAYESLDKTLYLIPCSRRNEPIENANIAGFIFNEDQKNDAKSQENESRKKANHRHAEHDQTPRDGQFICSTRKNLQNIANKWPNDEKGMIEAAVQAFASGAFTSQSAMDSQIAIVSVRDTLTTGSLTSDRSTQDPPNGHSEHHDAQSQDQTQQDQTQQDDREKLAGNICYSIGLTQIQAHPAGSKADGSDAKPSYEITIFGIGTYQEGHLSFATTSRSENKPNAESILSALNAAAADFEKLRIINDDKKEKED